MEIIRPWSERFPEYNIKPIRVYFAIDSDLSKGDELDRYKNIDKDHELDPAIQILCIVGKGVWFYYNDTKYVDEPNTYWQFYPNKGGHEELIILLGTIINQVISIVTSGSLDIKRYLIELIDELKLINVIR